MLELAFKKAVVLSNTLLFTRSFQTYLLPTGLLSPDLMFWSLLVLDGEIEI